jgi:hypothetical protein
VGTLGARVYLGGALDWVISDFKSIASRMGHVALGGTDAILDDVPLLVKALEFHEEEVRTDARRALARIAGEDLGSQPGPWGEWWDSKGRELREQREAEVKLEQLFLSFQGAVMTGQWRRAAVLLGFEARDHGHDVDLTEVIRRNRRALRKAWRDAGIDNIDIDGDRAKLELNWGRLGFESRELVARRLNNEWRFESPPWGPAVVKQPRPSIHTHPTRHPARHPQPMGFSGALAVGLCVVFLVTAILMFFAQKGRGSRSSPVAFLAPAAGFVFALALGVAVWRMVSRERRTPRPGRRTRAYPLPPRFGWALPAFLAYVLVVIVTTAFGLAGVGPGVIAGVTVSAVLVSPFAAFGWLHVKMRREYTRALASGELDGWRETVLRLERSGRPGFWGTLVVASLVGMFVIVPAATMVVAAFGIAGREVVGGLVALAVVLPIPVAAGVWLIPRASNEVERRRELESAASCEHETR